MCSDLHIRHSEPPRPACSMIEELDGLTASQKSALQLALNSSCHWLICSALARKLRKPAHMCNSCKCDDTGVQITLLNPENAESAVYSSSTCEGCFVEAKQPTATTTAYSPTTTSLVRTNPTSE